jgi:hypothetical protein
MAINLDLVAGLSHVDAVEQGCHQLSQGVCLQYGGRGQQQQIIDLTFEDDTFTIDESGV